MPSNTRSRVLCVDDDEDACEMLSLLLNSYRIDATCVRSAAEAWLKIKAERFDLYLLDVWLPRLDGFEFCRQLREFDSTTPILFYSGAAYDADKQKGIAAGANAYVTKPDVEGLIETISNLIAKAKADDVAARWVGNQLPPAQNSLSAQFFSVKTASH
jgi:DNA-binding response OmpR family regulator